MKIGLLDHMGYGNLGDAATQEALIENMRRRMPGVEIVGFSLNPEDTKRRHGIRSYSITQWHPGLAKSTDTGTSDIGEMRSFKSILKQIPIFSTIVKRLLYLYREFAHLIRSFKVLRSLDSLVIAGGGQLSELWRGPWSHPYNVLKFSVLTKAARRKLIVLNVGAGPLDSGLAKAFVKWSVTLADYVSFRDIVSQTLVQRLGVKRDTHVFPDSAYALDLSCCEASTPGPVLRPTVGINPIGFCDPRIWPKQDEAAYSRYLGKLVTIVQWLIKHNYRVRVYSGEASVDLYALEDLKTRLMSSVSLNDDDIVFLPPANSVQALLAEMTSLDFVITSKFHGVIFSHLLAKPVIAISYHQKISDLMKIVGHDQYCVPIENFTSKRVEEIFTSLVSESQSLKSTFRETARSYSARLTEQFDYLFISEGLQQSHNAVRADDGSVLTRPI